MAPGRPFGAARGTLIAVWLEPAWRGSRRAEAMLEEIVAIAGERWRTLANAGERWRTLANAGERWRTLANAGERGILQIELNVHAGNTRAIRFYESQGGFTAFGRVPRGFRAAEGFTDDILMVRMLDA